MRSKRGYDIPNDEFWPIQWSLVSNSTATVQGSWLDTQ